MSGEIIGGPCIRGCGDVAGHPGICLVTKLKPEEPQTEAALKVRVERLEHRVADLGAYVQAAVIEMRAKQGCCEEVSLLGVNCLKCGDPVVYDFYCEPHLPPKIRAIWDEVRAEER